MKTLNVTHTTTRTGTPLMTVANLPGPDAELTPDQARDLAAVLCSAALECETMHGTVQRIGRATGSAYLIEGARHG